MEWPNQTLLTADDTEFIRSAIDVALSTAGHEAHTGDIYDLNATTWAIWLVQHVYVVRKGSWTAESEQAQHSLTFENLYDWLETQHARGDNFNVTEQATKRLLHRYKLPFKKMTVPPKQKAERTLQVEEGRQAAEKSSHLPFRVCFERARTPGEEFYRLLYKRTQLPAQ